MELQFSDDLQRRVYEQVHGKDRKWLGEAVLYVRSVRRSYPPDDPRWNDDTTLDHILYYITVANSFQRDATLDIKNVLVHVRLYLDKNPCILEPLPEPVVEVEIKVEPEPVLLPIVKVVEPDPESERRVFYAPTGEMSGEQIEGHLSKVKDEMRQKNGSDQVEVDPIPEPEPEPTSTPVVKKKTAKKRATKKKTRKRVTKKKTTKRAGKKTTGKKRTSKKK